MAAGSRPWLELTLEADGDVVSAAGRTSTGEISAPRALGPGFTVTGLRQLQAEIGAAVQERRPLGPGLIEKAQALHRALFQGELRDLLQHQHAATGDTPLLLVLDLRAALLRAFPWEIACDPGKPGGFPGADPGLHVCRAVPFPGAPEPREISGAPRVLALSPSPDEQIRALERALVERAPIEWLAPIVGPRPRSVALLEEAQRSSPHVLHLVGRFDLDPRGRPALSLAGGERGEELLLIEHAAQQLQSLFWGPLRLVVLQAAPGTRAEAVDGAAATLVRMGAGAVVANHFALSPEAASRMAGAFHQALFGKTPRRGDVVASLGEARQQALREQASAELLAPVVYLPRAHEGAVDALILTAVKEEQDALLEVDTGAWPGSQWERRPGPTGFEVAQRTFEAPDGRPIRVAASRPAEMGQVAAASAGSQLIGRYRPRCIAMCGVCAGRRGDVELGDVIIADRLWTYDAGKRVVEVIDGEQVERVQGDLTTYQMQQVWKHQAEDFELDPAEHAPWLATRPNSFEAQEDWVLERVADGVKDVKDLKAHPDRSARCADYSKVVKRLWERGLLKDGELSLTPAGRDRVKRLRILEAEVKQFRVHVGPIGSGTKVVQDAGIFRQLSTSMRKVLGLEMEAAAIGKLAQDHQIPWMIVAKGVMDHADGEKNDQFKGFAARASAECLLAFLRANLPPAEAARSPDPRIFVFLSDGAGPVSRRPAAGRTALDPALESLLAGPFSLLLGEHGHDEPTGRQALRERLERELEQLDPNVSASLSLSALGQRYALHADRARLRKVCERVLKELLRARVGELPPFIEALAGRLGPGVHTTLHWLPLLERALAKADAHRDRSLYAIQLAAPASQDKAMILHRPPGQSAWEEPLRPPRPDLQNDIVVLRLSGGLSPEEDPILSSPLVTEDDHIEGLLQPEAALPREWASALLGWLRLPSRRFLLAGVSLLKWRHRMVLRWLRGGFAVGQGSVAWVAPGADPAEPGLWLAGKGLPGEQGVHVVSEAAEAMAAALRGEVWR